MYFVRNFVNILKDVNMFYVVLKMFKYHKFRQIDIKYNYEVKFYLTVVINKCTSFILHFCMKKIVVDLKRTNLKIYNNMRLF